MMLMIENSLDKLQSSSPVPESSVGVALGLARHAGTLWLLPLGAGVRIVESIEC